MKNVIGICTSTIEQLRIDFEELFEEIQFVTYIEFLKMDLSKSGKVAIVDSPSKLLLILDLPIVDLLYKNHSYERLPLTKESILKGFDLTKDGDFQLQHKIVMDFDLREHSYIAHLNEYHKSMKPFLEKIHNMLTKTKKESFDCLPIYKEKMKKNLFNPEMAALYNDFLAKKKGDYPDLFKLMRLQTTMSYDDEEPIESA